MLLSVNIQNSLKVISKFGISIFSAVFDILQFIFYFTRHAVLPLENSVLEDKTIHHFQKWFKERINAIDRGISVVQWRNKGGGGA